MNIKRHEWNQHPVIWCNPLVAYDMTANTCIRPWHSPRRWDRLGAITLLARQVDFQQVDWQKKPLLHNPGILSKCCFFITSKLTKFWIKKVYTALRKLMIVIADQISSHQRWWLLGNLLKVRWIRLAFLKFERLKVKAMMTRRWPQIFHFGEVYNPKLSSQIMTIILLPVLIHITIHSQATTTVAM